jgi:hypothetical protein
VQSVPLSWNAAGGASPPVLMPVKPTVTDADGAMSARHAGYNRARNVCDETEPRHITDRSTARLTCGRK